MINEKGLAACMKLAYKGRGYTILAKDEQFMLNAHTWAVCCDRDLFPRNCLGLLASHIGFLPQEGECYLVTKDAGAQLQLAEDASAFLDNVTERVTRAKIKQTPLTCCGFEVWQNLETRSVLCVDGEFSRILDADTRSSGGWIAGNDATRPALYFEGGEGVAIVMPRKRDEDNMMLQQLDGFPWCGE